MDTTQAIQPPPPHKKSPASEQQLWLAFKEGDEEAFAQIYKLYVITLYHYAERLTADRELIADGIQDLFVELWKNRETLGDALNLKLYLFKGLKRKIIKKLVKQRKFPVQQFPENYDFELTLSPEFDLIYNEDVRLKREKLLRHINRSLTPRQKQAITLKFYDNLSYQEVAALMSLSTKATYKLVYRAIEVLKHHFITICVSLLVSFY